jgi:hypothetical protein
MATPNYQHKILLAFIFSVYSLFKSANATEIFNYMSKIVLQLSILLSNLPIFLQERNDILDLVTHDTMSSYVSSRSRFCLLLIYHPSCDDTNQIYDASHSLHPAKPCFTFF